MVQLYKTKTMYTLKSRLGSILPIAILLLLLTSSRSFAQAPTLSYPTAAQGISRGLSDSLLTVKLVFNGACSGTSIKVAFPSSVTYVAGSVSKTSGTAALGISESSIADLSNPVFSITGAIATGNDITFTVRRKAVCGSLSSAKDGIYITFSGGCSNLVDTVSSVNSYNFYAPALSLTAPVALSGVDLGNSYNRTITLTNGGNGCTDSVGFWIKYPAGSITLNSLKIGATTLTPFFSSADSSYFKLSGSIFGGDNLFCNGESISLTENITVNKCNATTTYGSSWFPFTSASPACQVITATSGMTMSGNLPNLAIAMTPNTTWCPDGNYVIERLRIVNTGTGPATNISTTYWGTNPGANMYSFTDVTNWVVKSKAGVTLGTMSSLGSASKLFVGLNTSCANDFNWYNSDVTMNLPSLTIPAGDTVYVEYRHYSNKVTCSPFYCHDDYYGWSDQEFALSFQDQCASSTNTIPRTMFGFSGYPRSQYTVQSPPDVNAGTFDLKLNYSTLSSYVKSVGGRSYIYIKLPTDITMTGTISSSLTGYTTTLSSFQLHDTLFIPMIANSTADGVITIPMTATCGSGGIHTFNIGHLHWWDSLSCPAAVLSLACTNKSFNLHCVSPCPKGGATPIALSLKRINYGYPDNDNDNAPDSYTGLPDTTKVNRHNALNGDTVLATWNIKVFPNADVTDPNVGVPFNHVYIDFPLTSTAFFYLNGSTNQQFRFNPLPSATATVYPAGGGASTSCTVSPTVTSGIAHYDFSSCKSTWDDGDSLVVDAKFITGGLTNNSGYTSAITSAEVYASYTAISSPTTAPIALTTYTCDHFQDFMDVFNNYASFSVGDQIINGCSGRTLGVYLEASIMDNGAAAKFPYEARIISVLDTVIVRLPDGFTYEANSASVNSGYMTPGATSIPSANVIVSGNQVKFVNLKNLFVPYGGATTIKGELLSANLSYRVIPTCSSVIGAGATTNAYMADAGNGYNTPLTHHYVSSWGSTLSASDSQTTNITYNAPQSILSGGGLVTSTDASATWNVVLQNGSVSLGADNSWFYFTPVNGLTGIVVKKGATTITPDVNGFYRLGTLAPGANDNYSITATTTSCNLDSMRINNGFDCVDYPTSFTLQSCTKTAWLKVDNYPSQIQLSLTRQPKDSVAMCNKDTAEFVINSALQGFANNPVFVVTPPTGITITSGEIEYPVGSGNWQSITPTVSGANSIYAIENHTQVATNWGTRGLPGVLDFAGTSQRQAKLRLGFQSDCSFTSGSKIQVVQRADRPCGGAIPTSLGYDGLVQTNPIKIIGASGGGSAGLTMSFGAATNITCGTPTTLSLNTTPTSLPTQAGDTMIYTLPAGLGYAGNFVKGTNCTSCAITSSAGPSNTTIVKVKLETGVAASSTLLYSFDVACQGAVCGPVNITGEFKRDVTGLMCGITPCGTTSSVIASGTSPSITLDKPSLVISSVVLPDTSVWQAAGYPANHVRVRYSNNGSQAYTANADSIEFFMGSATTPFSVQPLTKSLAIGANDSSDYMIMVPTGVYTTGSLVTAKIQTTTTAGTPQCLCSPSSFFMAGAPLPLSFTSTNINAQNCAVTISWGYNVSGGDKVERFELERSSNGAQYSKLSSLPNSSNSYVDVTPSSGKWYYRIKAIGVGGSVAYSNTLIATTSQCVGNSVSVYPNPASEQLQIVLQGTSHSNSYELIDALGRVIAKGILTANSNNRVDVSGVARGVYMLKVITDGNLSTHQVQISK